MSRPKSLKQKKTVSHNVIFPAIFQVQVSYENCQMNHKQTLLVGLENYCAVWIFYETITDILTNQQTID